jgi:predicted DNA-binding transcriptional regulator YafY
VSWHGHWYVVGHDLDRDAERMFRVSRIVGQVRPLGEPGSYTPPADLDLRALAESLAPPQPHNSARLRVRKGAGDSLRRRAMNAKPVDATWTELEVPYASGHAFAEELLSYGPDIVVEEPPELRTDVVRRLDALAGSAVRT